MRHIVATLGASTTAHAEELAESSAFLAGIRAELGDPREARALYEQTLAEYARIVEPAHPQVREVLAARDRL